MAVSTDVINKILADELDSALDFSQNDQLYLLIPLTLNPCVRGQIFNNESWFCQKCPFGKFSIDVNDTECRVCPENVICDGGDSLSLRPGYWRTNNESVELLPCEPNSGSCL